jgi:hypothetical protein
MALPKLISELDAGGTPATTDLIPVSQPGGTRRFALSSLFDTLTGFLQSGTGASARSVQAKLRDLVSVKDFGVVGDGSTDDTTALQLAMDWLGTNDGGLYWPDGTYKLTASLTIAQIRGAVMRGQSRGGVTISQATNNTPIFTLTTCDSDAFDFSNFNFTWANQQTSSDTSAIAIYFAGTSGTPANGFYNFNIHHCTFNKGYRAISANDGIQLSLWGWDISDCILKETMVGAFIYLSPSPSIGIPNCSLRHIYLRCDVSSETIINLVGIGGLLLQSIEFNNGTIGGAGNPLQHLLLTSCNAVVMQNCREESATISATTRPCWYFASSFVTIVGAELGGIDAGAGIIASLITADGNSKVSVIGLNASTGTIGGGTDTALFNGTGFGILHNCRWTGTPGSVADEFIYRKSIGADVGDAAKALVVGTDVETQVWNTPIAADRAITLSTTITPPPGAKFRIVRTAAATGGFNLNVGTGPLKAMGTAGSFCEVQYNGATSAWMLTAYGTL